jgi:hypothetical protein
VSGGIYTVWCLFAVRRTASLTVFFSMSCVGSDRFFSSVVFRSLPFNQRMDIGSVDTSSPTRNSLKCSLIWWRTSSLVQALSPALTLFLALHQSYLY